MRKPKAGVSPAPRGRSGKQQQVLRELLQAVQCGELKPGARLPTRLELAQRFSTTVMTLQQVFGRLKQDGFIVCRGQLGTFVAETAPCFSRYGLLFPSYPAAGSNPVRPATPRWSLLWTALRSAAESIERVSASRLPCFYSVPEPDQEDTRRAIVNDLQHGRLAGLIFAAPPYELAHSPLVADDGIPRVAMMWSQSPLFPHVRAVRLGRDLFIERALDYLKAAKRRRVALITQPPVDDGHVRRFQEAVARRGMITKPQWMQGVPAVEPQWASNCVQVLMSLNQSQRPDALVMDDDHFVAHGLAGLLAAGVAVPRDAEVVALANFPNAGESFIPYQRLGYSSEEALLTAIGIIDRLRRKKDVLPITELRPMSESEYQAWRSDRLGVIGE